MRVLWLTNIPSPYRIDFFNEIGKLCELTVVFEAAYAKDRNTKWIGNKSIYFKSIYMKGIRVGQAEAFCPSVLKYLSKNKFDIIVVGMYSSPTGMMSIEYMRIKKIPFIISSDGGFNKGEKGFKYKLKSHFIGAGSFWLSTGKITNNYLEYYGAIESKIYKYPFTSFFDKSILNTPVDIYEKNKIREKIGVKENKMVLSVGQFIYRKGYDILLKACCNLDKNIGVYIVGGKPTEEYLDMKKIYKLDNVHFVDFMGKEELAEYYRASDLFVLPTREDIWGLVINEAMAYGLPVITTDNCVAGLELVENDVNGYIVPVEDTLALVEKINLIIQDNEIQKAMSSNSLKKIKDYTIENMAKVHFDIFNNLLNK